MRIKEVLESGVKILQKSGIARPRLEAEILLSFVLKCVRTDLHCHSFENVDAFFAESFMRLIARRSAFEPLEYLTESVSFYGEELYISYGALIPRPETEILVQKSLEIISENPCKNIAEIGIGSGAISVILSCHTRDLDLSYFASDISPEALFNAYVNKVKFNARNLRLYRSAYLDFNKNLGLKFDLLVSNPPYIKEGEKLPESLKYEPQKALFGGVRGDEILLHIISLASAEKISFLLCEMGSNQRKSVESFMRKIPHKSLEFYKDLAGLDRGFVVRF